MYDLVTSRVPDNPVVRRALTFRWANRVLGQLAPAALRHLGHEPEAASLNAFASAEYDGPWVSEVLEHCRVLGSRLCTASDRNHDDLVDLVLRGACETVRVIAREVGVIKPGRTRIANGFATVIEYDEAELLEGGKQGVLLVGAHARTIAQVVGGARGYIEEMAQQYAELYPDGQVTEYQSDWCGDGGRGALDYGKRYRVIEAFTDLDGVRHPWGESWRFDGCTFSPSTGEVRLLVSEGVQLDQVGRPGPEISVSPFRIRIDIGERPGRAVDVIRSNIDIDLSEWRPPPREETAPSSPPNPWTGTPDAFVAVEKPADEVRWDGASEPVSWRVAASDGAITITATSGPTRPSEVTLPFPLPKGEQDKWHHALELPDGILVGRNQGEWGGCLAFFRREGTRVATLAKSNTIGIVRIADNIISLHGLNHLSLREGSVRFWTSAIPTPVLAGEHQLDAQPECFAVCGNVLWVLTMGALWRIEDRTVERAHVVHVPFGPTSLAVDSAGDVWVGMTHFVLHFKRREDAFDEEWLVKDGG